MAIRFILLFSLISINKIRAIAQSINRFDIVIDEILPDPTPAIGLPNSEFIELKNKSNQSIDLRNWKISDGSSTAIINTNFLLKADSFVIICPSSSVNGFLSYERVITVNNFPSLNNDADIIYLISPQGQIIHSVNYSIDWYQNDLKSQGGWSLEMIDPLNPCGESNNWKASVDLNGGTPGKVNSVNVTNIDNQLPSLIRTYTVDSFHIVAVFDESLDSVIAASQLNYQITENKVVEAKPLPISFKEVLLTLEQPLHENQTYTLSVKDLNDCVGNVIGMMNNSKAGLPSALVDSQLIINELLFNPAPDGYDYVEMYNRSNSIVDLKYISLANKNGAGSLVNIVSISSDKSFLLFPQEFIVVTENKSWLTQHYICKDYSRIYAVKNIPSLPDDKGNIVLLNKQGIIIDELNYDRHWHFALIDNEEGVALERIDYKQKTQNKGNWTSAASTAGFGTPGYQNSQFRIDLQVKGSIEISPKIFSPDNDGVDDFAFIQYQFEEPNFVANIRIYDVWGKLVKWLVNNQTLSAKGSFRWDGLNDKNEMLSIGNYIVITEVFDLTGKVKRFKNVVSLVRKFK